MLKGFTRWFLAWFLVCFLAAVILLCLSLGIRVAAATGTAGSKPVTDPRPDMVTALQATGPHPSVGDQLAEVSLAAMTIDHCSRVDDAGGDQRGRVKRPGDASPAPVDVVLRGVGTAAA